MKFFAKRKESMRALTMLTCYDYTMAQLFASTDVDLLLVGDSVAMVCHGYPNTLAATVDMMCEHTAAVRRGAPDSFIVGDLPYMSTRKGLDSAMHAAEALMRAGASALKVEGSGQEEFVRKAVLSGIPIMGHVGLTPQEIHGFGGFKVQGRSKESQNLILETALAYEEAGAFACVVECVPASFASSLTDQLSIPVIGIGAGNDVDGQVLVSYDMLGLTTGRLPKFVRAFMQGGDLVQESVNLFCKEVQEGSYPGSKEVYA